MGAAEDHGREARPRPCDADRHIARRIRERRVMLGITQMELAELIGVTYQQAHKYEKGVNRVSAGRLATIARALDVGPGWFFEGIGDDRPAGGSKPQRLLLELTRGFARLDRARQEAVVDLVRALAPEEAVVDLVRALAPEDDPPAS